MEFQEAFNKEHALVRRALDVLEEMARRAEQGITIDRHDVNALLIFLHYFVDACHQTKEETILFPVLRQSRGVFTVEESVKDQLRNLLKEHTEERTLVEKTNIQLFSDKPSEFVASARKLVRFLTEHAMNEEQVLLPLAAKVLTREEADQVAMRIQQADAEFGYAQRNLLIDMLQELERKYLPKAA